MYRCTVAGQCLKIYVTIGGTGNIVGDSWWLWSGIVYDNIYISSSIGERHLVRGYIQL
ncbi:hypothetical protein BJX61DRAFT_510458 [Aspergillus egyptiacus]|nr:hypothetical protein BJX61DRAFT_510458 [Aspergillus egyptiacus]